MSITTNPAQGVAVRRKVKARRLFSPSSVTDFIDDDAVESNDSGTQTVPSAVSVVTQTNQTGGQRSYFLTREQRQSFERVAASNNGVKEIGVGQFERLLEDGVTQDPNYKKTQENCQTCVCPRPDCVLPVVHRPRLLPWHMKKVHNQDIEFACNPCNKPFKHVYQLVKHQNIVHNEKKWCSSLHYTWRVKGQHSPFLVPVRQSGKCWCKQVDQDYPWNELVTAGKFLPFVNTFIQPSESKKPKTVKSKRPAKKRQVVVKETVKVTLANDVVEPQPGSSKVSADWEVITLDSDSEDECEIVATPTFVPIDVKVEKLMDEYLKIHKNYGGADSLHTRSDVSEEIKTFVNLKMGTLGIFKGVKRSRGSQ